MCECGVTQVESHDQLRKFGHGEPRYYCEHCIPVIEELDAQMDELRREQAEKFHTKRDKLRAQARAKLKGGELPDG